MFRKIIRFFLLFLLLVILILVIFRNQVLKVSLKDFVHKRFAIECQIESVNLWFDSLAIKGLRLSNKDFDAGVKNILIKFKFQKGAPVYISEFDLSDATFKVKSLEGLRQGISKKKTAPAELRDYPRTGTAGKRDGGELCFQPIQFNLQNINIDLKSKTFNLVSNFSFIAEIGSDKIFVKDAGVSNLKISSQDFELDNLTFKKIGKNKYVFRIPQMRVKEKKFSNFVIPLKMDINKLRFLKVKNPFFGPDGYVSARVDLRRYDNFCFSANFQDVSFERMVDIFTPEDAAFRGLFDGALRGCVKVFKIETLEGAFRNKGNGFINIKKESSLAFLKPYLDKPSYDALIDNFKNYEYNIGVVSIKSETGALNFGLDFTSEAMGRRDIMVKFHDVLGGKK